MNNITAIEKGTQYIQGNICTCIQGNVVLGYITENMQQYW